MLQYTIFRWMEGQDLRQTLVTIALSLILADLMLWRWGGDFYQVPMPAWLGGPVEVPLVTAMRSSGELVYLSYPLVRLVILLGAIAIGILMWLALNRTKIGMLIRAGVDDRDMLSATGVRVQLIFLTVFAFGAGLAGFTGVVGGTFQSLQQGEDIKILLASLVVVIVGGMGSIPGAAVGAMLIGLADQFGTVYMPTYAVVLTFVIMVVVLALRPQGLLRVADHGAGRSLAQRPDGTGRELERDQHVPGASGALAAGAVPADPAGLRQQLRADRDVRLGDDPRA